MAQIFKNSTNTLARISIYGAIFFLGGFTWVFATLNQSAYSTRQGVIRQQPVPFSHDHHLASLGIDCRYCLELTLSDYLTRGYLS